MNTKGSPTVSEMAGTSPGGDETNATSEDTHRESTFPGDFERLLEAINRTGHLSICFMSNGVFTSKVTTVENAAALAVQLNLGARDGWFGIARLRPGIQSGRGKETDVRAIGSLPVDIDVKEGGMPSWMNAERVVRLLSEVLEAEPACIVNTGNGLQPWFVTDPEDPEWECDGPDDPRYTNLKLALDRFQKLVDSFAGHFGGKVDNVSDLARVLRIPGTTNLKESDDPKPVHVVERGAGTPITMRQLLETLDAYSIPEDPHAEKSQRDPVSISNWTWGDETCGYVRKMIQGWATDTSSARHPWLVGQATRLAAAHRNGCITKVDHEAAIEALREAMTRLTGPSGAGTPRALPGNEIDHALEWGIRRIEKASMREISRELGEHSHPPSPHLPEEFWEAHPRLGEIRQYAHATGIRPEIQLGAVLAVVNARIPVRFRIPAINGSQGSLNLLVVTLGRPGLGKSSAQANAYELTSTDTAPFDPESTYTIDSRPLVVAPLGSGEGIVSAFYEYVRDEDEDENGRTKSKRNLRRVHDSVLVADAEGSTLTQHMDRTGSILGAVLLKIFSGEDPSATVTKRNLAPGSEPLRLRALWYRAAVHIGIQPDVIGGFFNLAGVGWPQRLLYFDAEGHVPRDRPPRPTPTPWQPPPTIPDTRDPSMFTAVDTGITEIDVPESITTELQDRHYRYRQGEIEDLDVHGGFVQLKTAATLHALLNPGEEVRITEEDWRLAAMIKASSDATRALAQQVVKANERTKELHRAEGQAQRNIIIEERTTQVSETRVARNIFSVVNKHQGSSPHEGAGCTRSCLAKAINSRDRGYLAGAINHAKAKGWIREADEKFVPGDSTPADSRVRK